VALAAVAALVLPTVASASQGQQGPQGQQGHVISKVVGAVYTETNGTPNQIVAFNRHANGNLTKRQVIGTGGVGGHQPQPGCPGACPILDTQGELALTQDGKLLFAVNAGSNTITSFRVTPKGLKKVSQISSGGTFPNSLTTHGDLVYVLNTNSQNIAGFRFAANGKLTAITGSIKSLSSPSVSENPRQIGFNNNGRVLVVTLLGPPIIDTFAVKANGTPDSAVAHPSTTQLPFGFAFSGRDQLVVSQVHDLSGLPHGDTATYSVTNSGGLTPIDTKQTNGFAPCWVTISSDSKYVYVVNTGGPAPSGATVSVFKLAPGGKLTRIQVTSTVKAKPGSKDKEFAKTDEVLSSDGRFLYVLVPAIMSNTSRIDIYKVGKGGKLKLVGKTPDKDAASVSGLVGL